MTYIQPLLSIVILALAWGAYLAWRRPRRGRLLLIAAATAGLFLLTWLPFARIVQRPLEDGFPPRTFPAGDAGALVVISGAVTAPSPITHQRRAGSDTYSRCLYTAWLYRHWQKLPVLASGGPPRGDLSETPDALVMKKVLVGAGVPAADIWCEDRSHSTHENALYSARILREKGIHRIVLVTSVIQMLRAELCFRKQGLVVIPAACNYRAFYQPGLRQYIPSWKAVRMNEDALHEAGGLLYYWIRGWI